MFYRKLNHERDSRFLVKLENYIKEVLGNKYKLNIMNLIFRKSRTSEVIEEVNDKSSTRAYTKAHSIKSMKNNAEDDEKAGLSEELS
jgi:hypothetical protein